MMVVIFFPHPCCRMILHFFLFFFFFFSLVISRWEQHWTLTCWNMMRTPSQLFYVWTASELEDYWVKKKKKTILFVNALFCTFFMMHFFPVLRSLVKLWSSLTLLGCYQDQPCAFRVLQVSGLYPKCWERKKELFNLSLSVYGFLRNAVDALIFLTLKTKLSHVLHPLKQIQ